MTLALKPGVRIHGMRPEINFAMTAIDGFMRDHGHPLTTITSVIDGTHSPGSLHYVGAAFDIRTRDLPHDKLEQYRIAIKELIGMDFDVVIEPDHIHVEFQPKQSYSKAKEATA